MPKRYKISIVLPGEARRARISGVRDGINPREFFYGGLALRNEGHDVEFINARKLSTSVLGRIHQYYERKCNGITQFGVGSSQIMNIAAQLADRDIVFGFTDSFSLSLGLYRKLLPEHVKVIGGFHGLADWKDRVRRPFRSRFHDLVRKSLLNLDIAMTSGAADREAALVSYELPPNALTHYDFGVDQQFWYPCSGSHDVDKKKFFFAIGSDPQRDYDLISRTDLPESVVIVTSLNVDGARCNPKIDIIRGSLSRSNLTDLDIRGFYRDCLAVIVPVKNIWQPSGCSVTLQAMSCGKPVIITDYKGLFDRDILKDGENCLIIPPGDPSSLRTAMLRLASDSEFRSELSAGALRTAKKYFGIARMDNKMISLVKQLDGLSV
jgi:glycosyltransferase involved in cell wall biosynthesis